MTVESYPLVHSMYRLSFVIHLYIICGQLEVDAEGQFLYVSNDLSA